MALDPVHEPAPAPVVLLRPIRTMTISHDLAFRPRAVTVLSTLGPTSFAVASFDRPADIVDLIIDQDVDVVLMDVTVSTAPLAAIVNSLAARAPRVGVVIVADQVDRRHGVAILEKWGWAAELTGAVQHAYHRGAAAPEGSDRVRHNQH
jgi:hypothetical protein